MGGSLQVTHLILLSSTPPKKRRKYLFSCFNFPRDLSIIQTTPPPLRYTALIPPPLWERVVNICERGEGGVCKEKKRGRRRNGGGVVKKQEEEEEEDEDEEEV